MKNLRHYIDLVEATDTIRPRPEDFPPQDNKSYADAFAGTERDPATGNLLSQQQLQSLGLTQAQIDAGASERARNPVAGAPTPRPSYPIPSSPAPPTGSAALAPAQNPNSNTNIAGGPQGPAGRVPPKPAKKYLPVDEKLKPIQEKLKALGYDLGPAGVDGRMGKFTKQAIDDFSSGKPPGKPSSSADKKTTDGKTKTLTDQGKAQIAALEKQEAEQRAAGDKEGAEKTRQAKTQLIIQLSGNPGETPEAKKTTPEQDKAREEALARLEKQSKISENFDKLTPIEQIQKIRQIVDEAQQPALLRPPPKPTTGTPSFKPQSGYSSMTTDAPVEFKPTSTTNPVAHAAADAGSSTAGKAVKAALGSAWQKVAPGAGAAFGAYDAYHRHKEGDLLGAGLAGVSAIASFFPGPGTAIALGLDAINIGRDVAAGKFDGPKPDVSPQERAQVEQDWKTLEPYFTNPELFKSLPAKDQERLTKLKQRAAELSTAGK